MVDKGAKWSHYFNFQYADDNSSVILDRQPIDVYEEYAQLSRFHQRDILFINTKIHGRQDVCASFVAAKQAITQNRTFLWEFSSEPVDAWYKPPSFKHQCPGATRNLMELVLLQTRFRQPIVSPLILEAMIPIWAFQHVLFLLVQDP